MDEERRRQRQEIRLIQRESTWLQKALFALGKAEESHEKLVEERGVEEAAYTLALDDGELPVEVLEDALESRIKELMESVRKRRKTLR
jgi:hypothetical protein